MPRVLAGKLFNNPMLTGIFCAGAVQGLCLFWLIAIMAGIVKNSEWLAVLLAATGFLMAGMSCVLCLYIQRTAGVIPGKHVKPPMCIHRGW